MQVCVLQVNAVDYVSNRDIHGDLLFSSSNYKEALEKLITIINEDEVDIESNILVIKEYPDDKKRK